MDVKKKVKIYMSVCLAIYNGEKFIREQMKSITSQLDECDEIIIVDDCSTDNTISAIEEMNNYRMKIYRNEKNIGVVKSFERSLSFAEGHYIILADQDDVWLPGRMDCIRREIKSSDVLLLNAKIVDEKLNDSGANLFDTVGIREGFFANIFKNSFVGCCMAFKKDILKIALPFPHGLPWHDWYIGLIGELFFRVKRIDEPYLLYRRHAKNYTLTGSKSKNSLLRRFSMRFWMLYALVIASCRKVSTSSKRGIG